MSARFLSYRYSQMRSPLKSKSFARSTDADPKDQPWCLDKTATLL